MGIKRRLAAGFCIGLFLIGVGGGVTFAEFSSFRYAGERVLGAESMKEATMERNITDPEKPIVLNAHYASSYGAEIEIREDPSLKPDEIAFDITYNEDAVHVYISGRDEDNQYYLHCQHNSSYGLNYKDDILNSLKNREIPSYRLESIESYVIRVAPENVGRIEMEF